MAEKVGEQSLSNQITSGARAFRRVLTPLQNEIYLVVRMMLALVIYIEFLLIIDALLARANTGETIANATLVVGLVPNGLFLSITLTLTLTGGQMTITAGAGSCAVSATKAADGNYNSTISAPVTITVVNRGDLERAMEKPGEYPNLIVRVGGFSAPM